MSTSPDTLPTPKDPTGPCPWCGRVSNFEVLNVANEELAKGIIETTVPGYFSGDSAGTLPVYAATHKVGLVKCGGCARTTVVVTDHTGEGIHWYPPPGAGVLDRAVNPGVASAFDEGMRCLSVQANRAAAVMFRSALHHFVKDKGSDRARRERHLKTALEHMKNDRDLHKSLWEWADLLTQLGNEGAHPEDYDDVTAEEAEALGSFVRHLIRHEYEMPAQLDRARGLSPGKPEASTDSDA